MIKILKAIFSAFYHCDTSTAFSSLGSFHSLDFLAYVCAL